MNLSSHRKHFIYVMMSYRACALQVGPGATGNQGGSALDASITFSGAMVGPCNFYNESNGEAYSADCTSAIISIAAEYFTNSDLFTVSALDGSSMLVRSNDMEAISPISGAVTIDVSGRNNGSGALPCQSTCSVQVTIPLTQPRQ